MSNGNWDERRNEERNGPNADNEDDEEFGEFEGCEESEASSNMAQQMSASLQASVSTWATFPDNVPSQRASSSSLQPDLLPTQASKYPIGISDCNGAHSANSQMNINLDLPDLNTPCRSSALLKPAGGIGLLPLPDLSPTTSNVKFPLSNQNSSNSSSSLPDINPLMNHAGASHLNSTNSHGVSAHHSHLQFPQPQHSASGANESPISCSSSKRNSSPISPSSLSAQADIVASNVEASFSGDHSHIRDKHTLPKSSLEEQLVESKLMNQQLREDVEHLHSQIRTLQEEVLQYRGNYSASTSKPSTDHISEGLLIEWKEALQQQQNSWQAKMDERISRLENIQDTYLASEEKLMEVMKKSNENHVSDLQDAFQSMATSLTEQMKTAVQEHLSNSNVSTKDHQCNSVDNASAVEKVVSGLLENLQKNEAKSKQDLLGCLRTILKSTEDQLSSVLDSSGLNS